VSATTVGDLSNHVARRGMQDFIVRQPRFAAESATDYAQLFEASIRRRWTAVR
jgi:hypothetical protein